MLRLIGFFVLAVVLARVLAVVPVIGPLFQRTGFIGVWIAAILLAWLFSRLGTRAVRMQRDAAEIRRLTAVDSPYNAGKLGSLYLAQGRVRRALEPLRRAVEGEPEVAEWRYRLGCALDETGARDEALAELERCLAIDEEYAYGAAQLRYARLLLDAGRAEDALAALETFERNHGPGPESAFRRGQALRATGDAAGARAAYAEVSRLAADAAGYQRRGAALWSMRARLASLFVG